MIIRRIYLGELQIRRLYRAGILTNSGGSMVGKSESDVYCLASLKSAEAIVLDSFALSVSESDTTLSGVKTVLAEAKAKTITETSGGSVLLYVVPMVAEAKSDGYTKAVMYTVIYVKLGPITVPINTETFAQAYSLRMVRAASQVPIGTETLAKTLRFFAPLPFEAQSYDLTYASAKVQNIMNKDIGRGNNESTSHATGTLSLWRLPAVENNTLEISSAFDASVTDGILEVI